MKSTEAKEIRLQRVSMHDFFINRIDEAISEGKDIEASWLIYSCFENRYFRTVEKVKKFCTNNSKKCRHSSNQLALRTKIRCVQRLVECNVPCFKNAFPPELLVSTLQWVKRRNQLMHDLLQLEHYENMDATFHESVIEGKKLLDQTYACCTKFRKEFYDGDYEFVFPVDAMEKCSCKSNNLNAEEN